jgi:hypothetical protein
MSQEEIIEKIKQAAFVTVDGTTLRITNYDAIYFMLPTRILMLIRVFHFPNCLMQIVAES